MENKRYFQIDYAKAIGIFLVVVGHLLFHLNSSENYFIKIKQCIYSFHMPLFFILSGLVLGLNFSSTSENVFQTGVYIRKLVKRLLIPYFILSFIYIILLIIFLPFDLWISEFIEKLYFTISLYGISPLWFISTLFCGLVIFVNIINTNYVRSKPIICHFILLLTTFGLSIFINRVFLIYKPKMSLYLSYLVIAIIRIVPTVFFIEIGFLLSKIWQNYIKQCAIVKILLLIIELALVYYFKDIIFQTNYLYIFSIKDMTSFFISGILGSFLLINFCCLWNKEIKFISEIGKRTLDIMVLHYPPIPIFYSLNYIFSICGYEKLVFTISLLNLLICFILSKTICDKIRVFVAHFGKLKPV